MGGVRRCSKRVPNGLGREETVKVVGERGSDNSVLWGWAWEEEGRGFWADGWVSGSGGLRGVVAIAVAVVGVGVGGGGVEPPISPACRGERGDSEGVLRGVLRGWVERVRQNVCVKVQCA